MPDGRATSNRVSWRLLAVIVAVSFVGMTAAAHFTHTGLWYFIGWSTGALSAFAFMAWDEREDHG